MKIPGNEWFSESTEPYHKAFRVGKGRGSTKATSFETRTTVRKGSLGTGRGTGGDI